VPLSPSSITWSQRKLGVNRHAARYTSPIYCCSMLLIVYYYICILCVLKTAAQLHHRRWCATLYKDADQ